MPSSVTQEQLQKLQLGSAGTKKPRLKAAWKPDCVKLGPSSQMHMEQAMFALWRWLEKHILPTRGGMIITLKIRGLSPGTLAGLKAEAQGEMESIMPCQDDNSKLQRDQICIQEWMN